MKYLTNILIVYSIALAPCISINKMFNTSSSVTVKQDSQSSINRLKTLHQQYGPAKLILKDRGVYKNITVHELNTYWIVFMKDGSLHDMLIEKISKIEYGKTQSPTVTFNKENNIVVNYD